MTPPPNDSQNKQNLHFSRELEPITSIQLAGGGGGMAKKVLDVRFILVLRQFPTLAECPMRTDNEKK
jgi:hypothetical protein